eukprot:TRINITY_DN30850_c0_g1_i1.p1 TRINITY_DN30850_c0_g1~~TRINITY_DN30850_c0_g1_i1.p1  ORF type:complete len:522 (-),score=93.03 TRINITY_DN30850_c0_g1_i1:174-1739(-)
MPRLNYQLSGKPSDPPDESGVRWPSSATIKDPARPLSASAPQLQLGVRPASAGARPGSAGARPSSAGSTCNWVSPLTDRRSRLLRPGSAPSILRRPGPHQPASASRLQKEDFSDLYIGKEPLKKKTSLDDLEEDEIIFDGFAGVGPGLPPPADVAASQAPEPVVEDKLDVPCRGQQPVGELLAKGEETRWSGSDGADKKAPIAIQGTFADYVAALNAERLSGKQRPVPRAHSAARLGALRDDNCAEQERHEEAGQVAAAASGKKRLPQPRCLGNASRPNSAARLRQQEPRLRRYLQCKAPGLLRRIPRSRSHGAIGCTSSAKSPLGLSPSGLVGQPAQPFSEIFEAAVEENEAAAHLDEALKSSATQGGELLGQARPAGDGSMAPPGWRCLAREEGVALPESLAFQRPSYDGGGEAAIDSLMPMSVLASQLTSAPMVMPSRLYDTPPRPKSAAESIGRPRIDVSKRRCLEDVLVQRMQDALERYEAAAFPRRAQYAREYFPPRPRSSLGALAQSLEKTQGR